MDPRTDADYFSAVVLETLVTEDAAHNKFLSSVTAHVTTKQKADKLPVPSVIVFQYKPTFERPTDFQLEMELVEYEADE
jgi:hypothetical protein